MSAGIPIHCTECAAPLHAHNLTGSCAECKLIARNQHPSGEPADTGDPVTHAEAIANIEAVLGGRIISDVLLELLPPQNDRSEGVSKSLVNPSRWHLVAAGICRQEN
jgi:hypothetical protein